MTTNNDAVFPEFRAAYERMLAAELALPSPPWWFGPPAEPCKHRWATELIIVGAFPNAYGRVRHPSYSPHYNETKVDDLTKIFCATCGVTAHDAAVRTAASGD